MADEPGMKDMNSLIPSLAVSDGQGAIDLYKKAFDAGIEHEVMKDDAGKVLHAVLKIGNSRLFLSDMMPSDKQMRETRSGFYMYVKDADAAVNKAKDAGMEVIYPVSDMFWGDRMGSLRDKFGNLWTLATHVRDVSPEEIQEGAKKFKAMMAEKKQPA